MALQINSNVTALNAYKNASAFGKSSTTGAESTGVTSAGVTHANTSSRAGTVAHQPRVGRSADTVSASVRSANVAAASTRISDASLAQQVSRLARSQIRSAPDAAMQAQGNTNPEAVLRLLQ